MLFRSTGVEEGPSKYCEGNYATVYDKEGNLSTTISYYANVQPNFFFQRYNKKGEGEGYDHFKTYLGAKGQSLWYLRKMPNQDNQPETILLNDEQVKDLKQFFRWEREGNH